MPLLSLDERIRGWRLKFGGQRVADTSSLPLEGGQQQGRCSRLTHADGKIFWAYLWTSSAHDFRLKRLGTARTPSQSLPEAGPGRRPAA
jgi:hypothetical protein